MEMFHEVSGLAVTRNQWLIIISKVLLFLKFFRLYIFIFIFILRNQNLSFFSLASVVFELFAILWCVAK